MNVSTRARQKPLEANEIIDRISAAQSAAPPVVRALETGFLQKTVARLPQASAGFRSATTLSGLALEPQIRAAARRGDVHATRDLIDIAAFTDFALQMREQVNESPRQSNKISAPRASIRRINLETLWQARESNPLGSSGWLSLDTRQHARPLDYNAIETALNMLYPHAHAGEIIELSIHGLRDQPVELAPFLGLGGEFLVSNIALNARTHPGSLRMRMLTGSLYNVLLYAHYPERVMPECTTAGVVGLYESLAAQSEGYCVQGHACIDQYADGGIVAPAFNIWHDREHRVRGLAHPIHDHTRGAALALGVAPILRGGPLTQQAKTDLLRLSHGINDLMPAQQVGYDRSLGLYASNERFARRILAPYNLEILT